MYKLHKNAFFLVINNFSVENPEKRWKTLKRQPAFPTFHTHIPLCKEEVANIFNRSIVENFFAPELKFHGFAT